MSEPSQIQQISDYLLGTCLDVSHAVNSFEVDEDVIYNAIDITDIEKCSCCGWWYEEHELNEDLVCNDCQ